MKIEFLNVWSGKRGEVLKEFLKGESEKIDVFCFQEADKYFPRIAADVFGQGFSFQTAYKYNDKNDIFPLAVYTRNDLKICGARAFLENTLGVGLGQDIQTQGISIANIHGISRPGNKLDYEKRIEQSSLIIENFCGRKEPIIIGGDFNVEKETQSIRMFAEAGYRDLIRDFGIRTTRNRLVWEKFPEAPQYYSDYVFVGPGVRVKSFEVIENEVSDHLPMVLEIED